MPSLSPLSSLWLSYKATPNDPTNVVSSKPCKSAQTSKLEVKYIKEKHVVTVNINLGPCKSGLPARRIA